MGRRAPANPRFAIVIILSMFLTSTQSAAGRLPAICDARGKPVSLDYALPDVSGKSVDLRHFRGRVIVINFWATWCAPCRTEIPWLVEIHEAYEDAGLIVLGVSVDEDIARIAPFAAGFRMDYPVLVGRDAHEFRESLGPLLGYPTTLIITKGGELCRRHNGIIRRATLEADIRELLAAR